MKRLLLLTLTFCALNVQAQQYQCILPGSKQYFSNNKYYLRGMRIDSVSTTPSSVIYFPFHSPRLVRNNLDTAGGSWLGKSITVLPDGTTRFESRSDTVAIQTQAALNSSWVFYNDTSTTYYVAQVIQLDTMTIIGSIDSVKTVQLTTMKAGNPISSPLNNYRIFLSKTHGFASIFDLYNFPYNFSGAGSPGTDYFLGTNSYLDSNSYNFYPIVYTNPKYTDIYDFTAGDIFQTSGKEYPPLMTFPEINFIFQDSIQSRANTSTGINYAIVTKVWESAQYSNPPASNVTSWKGTRTLSIPDAILNVVDTNYMPEESAHRFIYYYNHVDTTSCYPSAYYKRQHYYFPIPLDYPPNEVESYKVGFGLIDSVNGFRWGAQGIFASYYSAQNASLKNNNPCKPLAALAVNDLHTSIEKSLAYPNPANEFLDLQWPTQTGEFELEMTDITGRVMYHYKGTTSPSHISVAHIPAGLYLLQLRSKTTNTQQTILIQH
jgi:hypothetical protein